MGFVRQSMTGFLRRTGTIQFSLTLILTSWTTMPSRGWAILARGEDGPLSQVALRLLIGDADSLHPLAGNFPNCESYWNRGARIRISSCIVEMDRWTTGGETTSSGRSNTHDRPRPRDDVRQVCCGNTGPSPARTSIHVCRRRLALLVAIRCLDEGVDVPATKTAFILASSTNPRQFVQRRGRVLRTDMGKRRAEIFGFFVRPPLESINPGIPPSSG
ncbi:MAG: helicase-related protein [Candidatus Binatia bacterium]